MANIDELVVGEYLYQIKYGHNFPESFEKFQVIHTLGHKNGAMIVDSEGREITNPAFISHLLKTKKEMDEFVWNLTCEKIEELQNEIVEIEESYRKFSSSYTI